MFQWPIFMGVLYTALLFSIYDLCAHGKSFVSTFSKVSVSEKTLHMRRGGGGLLVQSDGRCTKNPLQPDKVLPFFDPQAGLGLLKSRDKVRCYSFFKIPF